MAGALQHALRLLNDYVGLLASVQKNYPHELECPVVGLDACVHRLQSALEVFRRGHRGSREETGVTAGQGGLE